ncbi:MULTISPECIES: enoyl-CoA hydratase/isomerase family protein [unclassified Corynebacterium]|uniref:enoyl-CoA hydratase/isomerase family protein n=1 Tax=unclassified Corynebacterium TaxID=2624378 RepID=UPI000BAA69E3|nr:MULTISPECIES: enoyl-CoA hydratase/isomerase family protein [unclassified Corynebacterium]PAT14869.1 enoyl-CoA hydratase [Corynebacterium sp. NML 120412]
MSNQFSRFSALTVEDSGATLIIRLSRPEVKNAIDQTMVDELHAVCAYLEENPQVAIIVGTDGIFASGADIAQLRERRRDDALRGINNTIFHRIAKLPMPVIAAIDGYALGGGLELALAADFRVATARAKFGQPEAGLGIIAAAGGTWRLRAAVGEPLARDILLAGRVLDGEEALRHQLVSSLAEPEKLEAEALELAGRIGKQDPLAVRITKSVLAMPEGAHPQVDNLAQAILFESEAKFDRMQAFLDRKKNKKK